MVITVTCPSCAATFPVDTDKVPVGGVNARCSVCRHVFRVERPAEPTPVDPLPTLEEPAFEEPVLEEPAFEGPELEAEAFEADAGYHDAGTVETDFSVGTGAGTQAEADTADDWVMEPDEPLDAGGLDIRPMDTPGLTVEEPGAAAVEEPTPEPPPAPAPAAPPPPAEAAQPPVSGFTFGKRDPSDKARRLARVLVSDMIMYNSERHERALAAGTLKEDFEDEIAKSWKEYVDQVGEEMATSNSFWVDALNDVLAKGQKVF